MFISTVELHENWIFFDNGSLFRVIKSSLNKHYFKSASDSSKYVQSQIVNVDNADTFVILGRVYSHLH